MVDYNAHNHAQPAILPPAIYQQAEAAAAEGQERFFFPVIDSRMTREQALAQNPAFPAPQEVIDNQKLLWVTYWGLNAEGQPDKRMHIGQIVVAKQVANDVQFFFNEARRLRFPIAHAIPAAAPQYGWSDAKMMADNNTSGYNFRTIAGSTNLSNHAKGLAFDVNTFLNPYIYVDNDGQIINDPPGATYDPSKPGTLSKDHPLVKAMKQRGWTWGGDWTLENDEVIDYQHFEKPGAQ